MVFTLNGISCVLNFDYPQKVSSNDKPLLTEKVMITDDYEADYKSCYSALHT